MDTTAKRHTWDLNGVFFTDINTGVAVGDTGTVLTTTNGGITWIAQAVGVLHLRGVYFNIPSTATIIGDLGTILRTINGGTNWTPQLSGTLQGLNAVYFLKDDASAQVRMPEVS